MILSNGINLNTKEGIKFIVDFARSNNLMHKSVNEVVSLIVSLDEEVVMEQYNALEATLVDASFPW